MQRFKNILVVVDERAETRAVVERAVILAQRNQAHLTVANAVKAVPSQVPSQITLESPVQEQMPALDIVEEWPPGMDLPARLEPVAPSEVRDPGNSDHAKVLLTEANVVIREHVIEKESQRLELWVGLARQAGVPVTGIMLCGTPFLEIIREVLRSGHDLVMTCAEGSAGLKQKLLGSTTMHLMRKCPCPVWVVKPAQPEHSAPILAAVDLSPPDEQEQPVNVKILDLATSLARRQQCELVAVHTWSFRAEQSLRRGYLVAPGELDQWVDRVRDLHRHRFAELLRQYPLQELKAQVYMLQGRPGHLIPELATGLGVGLIVMGTVRRSGVAGLLMGTTAERILRQVDCSVLTVKPDSFATPVKLDD
jgi:nucleotide-binding universal stress UspA family protein